jgi:hypothetical protein
MDEDENKTPKTKTEAARGGRPPRKTRIGSGEGGSGTGRNYLPPSGSSGPPFRRSIARLDIEARDILNAMEKELDKSMQTKRVDKKELCLLHELLDVIVHEIMEQIPFDNRALESLGTILWRLERREDEFKKIQIWRKGFEQQA